MGHLDIKDVDPQRDSPLFSTLPPEVRNTVFELALTAYEDPLRRIDTNLLLTCRRVYAETASLPASINEQVSWYGRGPPIRENNHVPVDFSPGSSRRRRELRKIHLFTQQYWLESNYGAPDNGFCGFLRLWNNGCPIRPAHLKITIRHTDWWWWEHGHPLALDPKQNGRPSARRYRRPSDPFDRDSWGAQIWGMVGLNCLQLELETVERKMGELDAIVQQAKGWRFPLGDDHVLVLDESRTRRTGWIGSCLCHDWHDLLPAQGDQTALHENANNDTPSVISAFEGQSQTNKLEAGPSTKTGAPLTARQRLEAAGVQFHEEKSWKEQLKEFAPRTTCPYYVVMLAWLARRRE
ncbi:MAG: hypothetical protein Q9184_005314 [Pyrenodesmia sp. 2 TL-2023]